MTIDLHSHSTVSDGTLTPAELVRAAAAAGVQTLALTDHDTTAGWEEARRAGQAADVEIIPGVEVSTVFHGVDVHLLVYWPRSESVEFSAMLEEIQQGRRTRIDVIVAKLRAAGARISQDEVMAMAAGGVPGRPHVADALVAAGLARDRADAFDRWLADGRPGHVQKPSPPLPTAIGVAREAGGVPVIAHPWSRASRHVLTSAGIASLTGGRDGLVGLEVDHVDHDRIDRAELRALCRELGLVATGSSDHHGPGGAGGPLGCEATGPGELAALRVQAGSP